MLFVLLSVHCLNAGLLSVLLFLQIIQLVEGKASAYVFASPGCKKWDTCAPEAILHAVGGKNLQSYVSIMGCINFVGSGLNTRNVSFLQYFLFFFFLCR